jgi:hypothetical protein
LVVVAGYLLFSPILFSNLFKPSRTILNLRLKNLSRECDPVDWGRVKWFYFCERLYAPSPLWLRRGDARHRLKHVVTRFPQQGPTPIFSAATADGITTVQTYASAAAKTLPTTQTRERQIAARVKGNCTDRAIFTLLRCTTCELFFSCCDSVAAHFKHAATRQPKRKPAVETCVDNTAKLRPQASVLALRAAGEN